MKIMVLKPLAIVEINEQDNGNRSQLLALEMAHNCERFGILITGLP